MLMIRASNTPYIPPCGFHTSFIFSALCDCQLRSNSILFALIPVGAITLPIEDCCVHDSI